ncbi:MAG TPA: hypothetical protein DHV48_17475 [Prolixibacteraceae bacterium]|nr:MAG: hypothetical protein A2066_13530 [Bacteroidetes bacterium GWB2_41_8]HCY43096.1 hypothetical protein [Prolixibacteraceae bacterium]
MHKQNQKYPLGLINSCFLAILFFATGFSALGQESKNDSLIIEKKEAIHSPRKATIYSAVLPGLGQIYNRKYWKVPLVYGGFATLGYFINFNNEEYVKLRQAYSDIIDTDPNTNSFVKLVTDPKRLEPDRIGQLTESLRKGKDYWRRNRDLVVIGTVVFYAVNIIDASVDAHFFNFDISDDLTINWVPGPVMCMDNKLIGIHCRFTF